MNKTIKLRNIRNSNLIDIMFTKNLIILHILKFYLQTGQQESVKEMERHKRLEENYRHNWEKEKEDE